MFHASAIFQVIDGVLMFAIYIYDIINESKGYHNCNINYIPITNEKKGICHIPEMKMKKA